MLIFGGVAVLAGILVLHLPETLNANLPETIEQAEDFSRSVSHIYLSNKTKKVKDSRRLLRYDCYIYDSRDFHICTLHCFASGFIGNFGSRAAGFFKGCRSLPDSRVQHQGEF